MTSDIPTYAQVWTHVKTGTDYQIINICKLEGSGKDAVSYERHATPAPTVIWVRDLAEFMDGRFVLKYDATKFGIGYHLHEPNQFGEN